MKIVLTVAAAFAVAAGALAWGFRSGHTRLTSVPAPVASLLKVALPSAKIPKPAHVVVIIEENKDYADVIGNTRQAPYLNQLAAHAAVFTHSYGVAHPSQPNYLALFAGVTDSNGDGCPPAGITASAPNLEQELLAAHFSFGGYAEDLPARGFTGCFAGNVYARKHVPWVDFSNVPARFDLRFSDLPQYDALPTVAFIIPNLLDDMHSASIRRGDEWLQSRMSPLFAWAGRHDTLVIITWDESDSEVTNHIPTIFFGPMVRPGRYTEPLTHYRVLRTIEAMYGLPAAGKSAAESPVSTIWTGT